MKLIMLFLFAHTQLGAADQYNNRHEKILTV